MRVVFAAFFGVRGGCPAVAVLSVVVGFLAERESCTFKSAPWPRPCLGPVVFVGGRLFVVRRCLGSWVFGPVHNWCCWDSSGSGIGFGMDLVPYLVHF